MSDQAAPGLVIVGGGGHARSVADVAARRGTVVVGVVDPSRPAGWDVPVFADVAEAPGGAVFAVAIGSNTVRARELAAVETLGLAHATVVASTATVGGALGPGCQVLEHAHVGPRAILGRGVIVNTAAVIEHDVVLEDHVHVAPGARILGGAHIGAGSMVGSGAVVLPSIHVGPGAVVGAGSVVVRDVPAGAVVRGIPARPH